ncbi:helix-turn-helix transcriptional regulator [Flavobacterium sp. DGU11]|uniref:Helix-turn-helix transcriptional regulator n=1 Tax=Flavobacterium arundinis TaxID=3139143 RepID=A0ABU9HTP2_9FLAO
MNTNKILNRLKKESVKDTEWLQEAKYRRDNSGWIDISFSIAVKAISAMKKKGMTQKELAVLLNCSPQYVNKLLKGQENISLETIYKLQNALDVVLFVIPNDHKTQYEKSVQCNLILNVDKVESKSEKKRMPYGEPLSITEIKWKTLGESSPLNC